MVSNEVSISRYPQPTQCPKEKKIFRNISYWLVPSFICRMHFIWQWMRWNVNREGATLAFRVWILSRLSASKITWYSLVVGGAAHQYTVCTLHQYPPVACCWVFWSPSIRSQKTILQFNQATYSKPKTYSPFVKLPKLNEINRFLTAKVAVQQAIRSICLFFRVQSLNSSFKGSLGFQRFTVSVHSFSFQISLFNKMTILFCTVFQIYQ